MYILGLVLLLSGEVLIFAWLTNGDWYFEKYIVENKKHKLYNFLIKKDPRLERLLKETLELCASRGFLIPNLEIRSVSPLLFSRFAGSIYYRASLILIFNNRKSDDSLRILIAHEVGHAVKKYCPDHPFLRRMLNITYNEEDIADFVAAYLYGKELFLKAYNKHPFPTRIIDMLDSIEFTQPYLRA